MNTKKCSKCEEVKPVSEFHRKKTENRYSSWCKSCLYEFQKKRWKDRKRKAVEMLGGECQKCGYRKNLASFHFHHLDPSQKKYNWDKLRLFKWDRVVKELKKCILLCANCHSELHAPDQNIEIESLGNENNNLNKVLVKFVSTGKCPNCEREVYGTKYCSVGCAALGTRKVKNRPSQKELMAILTSGESWCSIGKKYGVSDNAVRKWAKQYGLL